MTKGKNVHFPPRRKILFSPIVINKKIRRPHRLKNQRATPRGSAMCVLHGLVCDWGLRARMLRKTPFPAGMFSSGGFACQPAFRPGGYNSAVVSIA
jgi:hypothetical protein